MTGSSKQEDSSRPLLGRFFLSLREAPAPAGLKAQLIFWPIAVSGAVVDLWSKKAVFDWLRDQPDNSFSIIDGFLQFVMVRNDGGAFGIAGGQRPMLIAASVIMLIAVVLYFLFFSGKERTTMHVVLGLFAAGIYGNLHDRVFNEGLVRDFIDVVYWPGKHWPAFNVADSLLCIAVGLVMISLISGIATERSCRKHAQPHK